jgi:streptogramin lyase
MGWFHSALRSLHRPPRESREVPRRNRPLVLEDLEGRRPLSQGLQPIAALPGSPSLTTNLISGPDGNLWVGGVTPSSAAIDRIGLDGSVTSFPVPVNAPAYGFIDSLATGPDGNVWFEATDSDPGTGNPEILVGNVTTAGHVTELPPIPVRNGDVFTSKAMIDGPGGALWFGYTDLGFNSSSLGPRSEQSFVVRVTTAGAVTVFPIPSYGLKSAELESLAAGPDGNLWFTEDQGPRSIFGRISPSGVVTRLPVGNLTYPSVANAPDGSLIVSEQGAGGRNAVFRVSATGALTREKIPASISGAFLNELGPADGSLWFANGESAPLRVGRITASGAATAYKLSGFPSSPFAISMAPGRDGNLYLLAKAEGNAIVYRLSPSELPPALGAGKAGSKR